MTLPTSMRTALRATAAAAAITVLLAGVAQAQSSAPADTAPQAATADLGTVVITSQRREEKAQDVGIALSVVSGDSLAERGIQKVFDLQYSAPNVEIDPLYGSDNVQFRIRGVGLRDYASNNTATVGVYVDDVAYPFPVQTQGLLFDVDRVEILRGPQGTLYGRNSTGGAVNYVTKRPTKQFEGFVTGTWGSYNAKTAEGYISGPFSETLRGRLAFATQQDGAWQRNRVTGEKLGDQDTLALRGQLELDATRDLNLRLAFHHGYDKSDSRGLRLYQGLTPAAAGRAYSGTIAPDTDYAATGWSLSPRFAALTGLSVGDKPHKDNTSDGVSLHVDWDLGAVKLTSITSKEKFDRFEFIDWDGSIIPQSDEVFKSKINVFSQELRLSSRGGERLNWVGGFYYSDEKLDEKFYSDFTGNGGYGTLTQYGQKARAEALFGQADYALAERFKLVAGLRQEHEKRNLNNFTSGYTFNDNNAALANTQFFSTPQNRQLSTTETSGKLALEYKPEADKLVYASISRGVKSGGFTVYNSPYTYQVDPFNPEKLLAYELGFKADFGRSLRVNGAAFYYDYRDQQVLDSVWIPSQTGGAGQRVGRIVNAPKSEIKGVELELDWRLTSQLQVTQLLGYKEGKYKEFYGLNASATTAANAAVYSDYSGTDLAIPKISYGGSIRYTWTAGSYRLAAQGDYVFRDKIVNTSDPTRTTKSYWLANARLELSPLNAPWTVALWARNLFDRKYDVHHGSFLTNAQIATSGLPRTIGIQGSYAF
ncbi:TonB-dependent receptor [Xylophilus sp.]|uniref:TonB-dependent receptor n=1 Tax=Xylophilus sp. TaxID=2653893 RepID=UPI0013B94A18|nr:TonB-dependent receptor [Xylophilus sp.]KAF1049497.1 MAG: Pesticin receptor [Xylophilus sp.]